MESVDVKEGLVINEKGLNSKDTFDTNSVQTYHFASPDHDYTNICKTSILEGVAYFFFILSIFFSGGDHTKFVFGFWCIFMVFGNLSGAHVNPIVSVGLYLYHGNLVCPKNIFKLVIYILAQVIGGIIAAVVSYFVYKKQVAHVIQADPNVIDIFLVESFFSGTIVFVALFITCSATRPSNKNYVNLTLLTIWIFLCINGGVDISGGCYNPTVYIVLNGVAYFSKDDLNSFNNFWVMVLSPFVGSVIFTIAFKYAFKPYYTSKNTKVISEND
jgi:glycerol uptake facilitator-like aquaporin